jgi:uncharacterized repeat protein (TIGR03847 family)
MADARLEFTNISRLQPDAQGEPGKRTFRVLADSDSSSAVIWLEKEQLFQLALGIQQLLATLPEDAGASGKPPFDKEAPGLTSLDFKVGKLVLGHDGSNGMFLIDAHDMENYDERQATIRLWANRNQMKDFAEEALRVCAAGRPLCPLCGRAIDPEGHLCPRVNGHAKITDLDLEEE